MALRLPYGREASGSRSSLLAEVQGELGTAERGVPTASECYQCGKCTAGCPVAYEMDIPPHQMMRAVQLGMRDAALSSRSIWVCAACDTCSARCPQDADPAGVMDALRRISFAEGVKSPEPEVPLFHRLFLGTVQRLPLLVGRRSERRRAHGRADRRRAGCGRDRAVVGIRAAPVPIGCPELVKLLVIL